MCESPTLSEDARRELDALLADGRKIEAIKVYREATGCDLVEAKTAVESIMASRDHSAGPAAKPIRPSSGCASMVFLLVLLSAVLTFAL